MRLSRVRVKDYRSIRDTGLFEVEADKTIIVGPNEAGKTALLEALQRLNPPEGTVGFDPLRDYPRADFNDITTKKVDPSKITVVSGHFALEEADRAVIPREFAECQYVCGTRLNNSRWHRLEGGPPVPTYGDITKDLNRLEAHVRRKRGPESDGSSEILLPDDLSALTEGWDEEVPIEGARAKALRDWLEKRLPFLDEENQTEENRYDRLRAATEVATARETVLATLKKRLPVLVLFNNYFRVRPLIHLEHLAKRLEQGLLDDKEYDYGNGNVIVRARDLREACTGVSQ